MEVAPGEVDVAIIGSGVVGLFTAYHLLSESKLKVAVFDRGPLGGVASPRAGGLLRHHYPHPLIVEMAMKGHEFYRDFDHQSRGATGYVQNGYLLAVSAAQADWLAENVGMVRDVGVPTSLVPVGVANDLIPWLYFGQGDGAFAFDRSAAFVQPRDLVRVLVERVRALGGQLWEGTGVVGIEVNANDVAGVWTERNELVKASVVVNAAGAWASKVGEMVSRRLPVSVRRLLQIQELRLSRRVAIGTPSFSSDSLDVYSRPTTGNRILLGSRTYLPEGSDPDDLDLIHTPEAIGRARASLEEVTERDLHFPVFQAWGGIDGDSPDFQPIIGPVPGVHGLLIGAGLSAHGFKLGPIIGQLLADLILCGSYRAIDATPLQLSRFENGQLFPIGYKQMGA